MQVPDFWDQPHQERILRLRELEGLLTDVPIPGGRAFARHISSAIELDRVHTDLKRAALKERSQHLNNASALRALTFPSVGHQLVPSQNRMRVHRLAWLYLLLRAFYVSYLWDFLGLPKLMRLRERLLVVEEEEGTSTSPPKIGTILESAPSSDMTYNAGAEMLGVYRMRAVLAIFFCCVGNLASWTGVLGQSYLPQGAPAQGAAYMLSWALDCLVLLVRALTEQRPSYMGFGVVTLFIALLSAVAFMLLVLHRLHEVLPYSGTGKGDLPSVMPLILDAHNTPFAMVSYAWGDPSPYADTARALAAALPNAWVDVHMMCSGSPIPVITAEVARITHMLVLVITPDYLHSKNCVIELVSALLHRGSHQATWAYVAPHPALPETVLHHLSARLGVRLFTSVRELLEQAGSTVYRVSAKEDVARLTRWFAVHADAQESVSRNFRLPPPAIQRGSALPCGCGGRAGSRYRLCRPRGSLHAGHCFLAPDALETGRSFVWVEEQLLLLVSTLALFATLALLQQGYIHNVPIGATLPWDVPLSIWIPLPLVMTAIVIVIFVLVSPFALHLDVRTHHSAQLLPLCVAAFIDTYDGGLEKIIDGPQGCASLCVSTLGSERSERAATKSLAPASRTPASAQLDGYITFLFAVGDATAPGSPSTDADAHLQARIDNIRAFMGELGLRTEQCAFGAAHPAPAALKQHQRLCVAVFVLRSLADAEHWLRTHCERRHCQGKHCSACGTFPLSTTILLWAGKGVTKDVTVEISAAETLHFNDYIYLTVDKGPAYDGFAAMLLDHIGAKIGKAYLSALRQQVDMDKAETTEVNAAAVGKPRR